MGVCYFLNYFSGVARFTNHVLLVINRYNSFSKITAFVLYCWICMDMLCSTENSVCLLGWVVLYFWLCIFPRTAVGLCCTQCEVLHGVHCFPTFLHTLCVTLHTVCKTQGV